MGQSKLLQGVEIVEIDDFVFGPSPDGSDSSRNGAGLAKGNQGSLRYHNRTGWHQTGLNNQQLNAKKQTLLKTLMFASANALHIPKVFWQDGQGAYSQLGIQCGLF